MEMWPLLYLILIVCLAAFIQGLTGFGVGIYTILFLPYVFSYQASVAITAFCAIVMSCVLLFDTREHVEIKNILPVVIPIVIMQMISTYFLFVLDDATLTIILVFILLFRRFVLHFRKRVADKSFSPQQYFSGLCNRCMQYARRKWTSVGVLLS